MCSVYMWTENSPAANVVTDDLFQLLQDDILYFDALGKMYLQGILMVGSQTEQTL